MFFGTLKKLKMAISIYRFKNERIFFGDSKSFLKAKIKINNPSFCFKLLRKGSSGLGESYINNEFETDDLTSLIELSARNINVTYKFSGFLNFLYLKNFLKKIFSIQKKEVKKIYLCIMI